MSEVGSRKWTLGSVPALGSFGAGPVGLQSRPFGGNELGPKSHGSWAPTGVGVWDPQREIWTSDSKCHCGFWLLLGVHLRM